jgi:CheY-like chemotaxis protein
MAELNPAVLHDQGLAAGLRWLSEYMNKHGIAVTATVPEKVEFELREDQTVLLFQSVRELLMNACKYAGTGEAAIVLEQTGDTLRITVSDHGAGFDCTASADKLSPLSSKYGLFSIRERMKALGGNFDIRSALGHGTTATLTLPVIAKPLGESGEQEREIDGQVFVASHPALTTHHSLHQTNTIRVLLVDDHPMMRQGLRSIVAAYDHLEVVGEANDGAEAVELVRQLNPDVVVMDINMPKMDGVEATRQIKANQPTTVVIGLSVNQSADTEQKMKAAGAATYLTKEGAVDALCHAIEQAMSCKQHTVARPVH